MATDFSTTLYNYHPLLPSPLWRHHPLFTNQSSKTQKEIPAIPLCLEAINNIISFLGLHDTAQVARSSRTWHNLTKDALARKIDPATKLPRNAINKVLGFLEPSIRSQVPPLSRTWNALTRKYVQDGSVSELPTDVLNTVLNFLEPSSRARIATSSRRLYDLVKKKHLNEISLVSEYMLKALMYRFSISLKNILDDIDKVKKQLSANLVDQKLLNQLKVFYTQTSVIYKYIISSKPIDDNLIHDLKKFYETITQNAFYIYKTLDQLKKNASPAPVNDHSETLSSLLESLENGSNELYIRLITGFHNLKKNLSKHDHSETKPAISVLLKHLPTDFFENLPRHIKSTEVLIDGHRIHETFRQTVKDGNNHKRSASYKIASQELLKINALQKSIELANLITLQGMRRSVLINISTELLKIDENAAIALFLAQEPISNLPTVINFCHKLAHNGNFTEALTIINTTASDDPDKVRELTLQVLTKLLDFDIKDLPRDRIVIGILGEIEFESKDQKLKFISDLSEKIKNKIREHTKKDPKRIIYLLLLCELDNL